MSIVIGNKTISDIYIENKDVQRIVIGNKVAYEKFIDYLVLENTSVDTGIFKMVKNGTPSYTPDLEYSFDKSTWTSYDFSTLPNVNVSAGSKIYFRGTNANQQFNKESGNKYYRFSFDKSCEMSGNICSIFNPNPSVFSAITSVGNYGLKCLFVGMTHMTKAPDFSNFVTIGTEGLGNCFEACSALTTPPDLSNITTINSSGLVDTFYDCSALTTPPDLSSLTTLGDNGMQESFSGCTSFTYSPNLSSLTSVGNNGLENCFSGCTSIVTPPNLSSLTSIGVEGLSGCFSWCSAMTSGPDLSNLTTVGTSGLSYCFYNCANVANVTAPNISNLTTGILSNWLNSAGGSATGTKTVNIPTGATITTGSVSGVPTGWTTQNY